MHTKRKNHVIHAILGGTFDPCHLGHLRILEHIDNVTPAQKISILPAKTPMHKTPFCAHTHRLNMLKLMLNNTSYTINHTEMADNISNETIDTVKKLHTLEPEHSIIWVLGDDSFASFNTWQNWQQILDYCNIIILKRSNPGYNEVLTAYINAKSCTIEEFSDRKNGCIHLAKWDIPTISSTYIRDNINSAQKIRPFLDEKVYNYIKENGLYQPA